MVCICLNLTLIHKVNICFNKHWQLSHEIRSFRAFYSCLCFHCPSFGLPRHYVLNLCIYLCMHAWVCAIVHTYMCASRSILQFACRWLLVSVISYLWLNDVEFCLLTLLYCSFSYFFAGLLLWSFAAAAEEMSESRVGHTSRCNCCPCTRTSCSLSTAHQLISSQVDIHFFHIYSYFLIHTFCTRDIATKLFYH